MRYRPCRLLLPCGFLPAPKDCLSCVPLWRKAPSNACSSVVRGNGHLTRARAFVSRFVDFGLVTIPKKLRL
jgi:hypothetical protein